MKSQGKSNSYLEPSRDFLYTEITGREPSRTAPGKDVELMSNSEEIRESVEGVLEAELRERLAELPRETLLLLLRELEALIESPAD